MIALLFLIIGYAAALARQSKPLVDSVVVASSVVTENSNNNTPPNADPVQALPTDLDVVSNNASPAADNIASGELSATVPSRSRGKADPTCDKKGSQGVTNNKTSRGPNQVSGISADRSTTKTSASAVSNSTKENIPSIEEPHAKSNMIESIPLETLSVSQPGKCLCLFM